MSVATLVDDDLRDERMSDKVKADGQKRKAGDKQVAVRMPDPLIGRVEDTALGLGLDSSSLIRMVLVENLPRYERRVDRLRRGLGPDESSEPDDT